MNIKTITVHVRINSAIFRSFALFDTFRLRKKWKAPALFCAIFLCFAQICFMLENRAEQAAMIGTLLLIIGVALPAAYILFFLVQVHDQCKRLGLKTLRPAYTLNMTDTELRVINDMVSEPEGRFSWDSIHGVWRAANAFYLYVTPGRAFLLPDGQCALSAAQLWDYLLERAGSDKLHGKKP